MSTSDHELDRAIASLTDVSPPPALRANVMRRVAEVRASRQAAGLRSAGLAARLAFAAAAVVLVAVSMWFAWRPAPLPETAGTQPAAAPITPQALPKGGGDTRAAAGGESAPAGSGLPFDFAQGRQAGTTPRARGTTRPVAIRQEPDPTSRHGVETEERVEPVNDLPPAVPSIELPPIQDPAPLAIPPVVLDPIDIPKIQIPPVENPFDKVSPATKTDSEKRQG